MRSDSVKVPLSSPIQAHGEELKELEMRPPTGKDIRISGVPYRIAGSGEIMVDGAAVANLVVALSGIPLSSVDQLSAADFQAVIGALMGFFQPPRTA